MCKPGVCWFIISIILSLAAALTCFGLYATFGGPPPLLVADLGIKILYISSIITMIVSFVSITSLCTQTKALCLLVFCEVGLVFAFGSSFYLRSSLRGLKLDSSSMIAYTRSYYLESGEPPPFLNTLQHKLQCCGINGPEDYQLHLPRDAVIASQQRLLPGSCCNFTGVPVQSSSSLRCEYDELLLSKSPDREPGSFPDYIHANGCARFLESSIAFLSTFPLEHRYWFLLPLYFRDIYLTLITLYNFALFVVFNYYAVFYRCRRRRPAVIPRGPPIDYDDVPVLSRVSRLPPPHFPFAHYPGGGGGGGPAFSGMVTSSGEEFRPHHHPFMISAVAQTTGPMKNLIPQNAEDQNNNNPRNEKPVSESSAPYSKFNAAPLGNMAPTAPPAYF